MSDYEEIAERIAKVMISPETMVGLLHGVVSVPLDFAYLVYGYLDTDSRYPHQVEKIRVTRAVVNGILNYDRVLEAVQIIFTLFDKYVAESRKDKIYGGAVSSVVGRITTNAFISSQIVKSITESAMFHTRIIGTFIGNFLLAGGMMERSIRTSERLSTEEPEVYYALRNKDYDLLYFLFEPALKPFVDALAVQHNQGSSEFTKIIKLVDEKLGRYHE